MRGWRHEMEGKKEEAAHVGNQIVIVRYVGWWPVVTISLLQ